MIKKITFCIVLACFLFNLTSSFAFADNEFIQTSPGYIYDPDCNMSLLEDELSTDINEEYYNSDHFADGEEDTTIFDNDQDFVQSEQLPNSDRQDRIVQDEQNADVYNDYSISSVAVSSDDDDNGIALYSADDSHYIFPDGWNGNFLGTGTEGGWGPWRNCYAEISTDDAYTYSSAWILNYVCPLYAISSDLICEENFVLFHDTTEMSDSSTIGDKTKSRYVFYFIADDSLNFSSGYSGDGFISYAKSGKDTFLNDNYVSGYLSFNYQKNVEGYALTFDLGYVEIDGVYKKFNGSDPYKNASLIFSAKDVYVGDTKLDRVDDSGLISGDIKGDFNFKDKSTILEYKAYYEDEIDKSYDVHLFALDTTSCPKKINSSLGYSVVDMNNYDDLNLKLTPTVNKVSGSLSLENAYYYIHQMKGYDDSLESVSCYKSDDFEARQNVMYALAYRESVTTGDWIVCKYYLFDYTDIIENVIGDFTVKKNYQDFPDMNDYIESLESWDDVASDCSDEDGSYNIIEVAVKWIGRNLAHFAHNFVGFFKWLVACIPVLWENLTIALYNLVCDLKSLALYLFNPKSVSIYQMASERIPSLNALSNAIRNPNSLAIPSLTFFGFELSLDFSKYFDVAYAKSIFSLLYVAVFSFALFKLIMRVFSFDSGGDEE